MKKSDEQNEASAVWRCVRRVVKLVRFLE